MCNFSINGERWGWLECSHVIQEWCWFLFQDVVEGEYEVRCSGEPDKSLLATVKVTSNCGHHTHLAGS